MIGITANEGEMNYPVEFMKDDGTVLVSFPDFPVPGPSASPAARLWRLPSTPSISASVGYREDIPDPSPANGRETVALTLLGSLKLEVYRAMRARGWRKADLAGDGAQPATDRPPARPPPRIDCGATGEGTHGVWPRGGSDGAQLEDA